MLWEGPTVVSNTKLREQISVFFYPNQVWFDAAEYLRGAGRHEESVRPPWMIIVVHCSRHVKGHELQSGYEAGQAAVTILWHSVGLRNQEAHVTVCYSTVRV